MLHPDVMAFVLQHSAYAEALQAHRNDMLLNFNMVTEPSWLKASLSDSDTGFVGVKLVEQMMERSPDSFLSASNVAETRRLFKAFSHFLRDGGSVLRLLPVHRKRQMFGHLGIDVMPARSSCFVDFVSTLASDSGEPFVGCYVDFQANRSPDEPAKNSHDTRASVTMVHGVPNFVDGGIAELTPILQEINCALSFEFELTKPIEIIVKEATVAYGERFSEAMRLSFAAVMAERGAFRHVPFNLHDHVWRHRSEPPVFTASNWDFEPQRLIRLARVFDHASRMSKAVTCGRQFAHSVFKMADNKGSLTVWWRSQDAFENGKVWLEAAWDAESEYEIEHRIWDVRGRETVIPFVAPDVEM